MFARFYILIFSFLCHIRNMSVGQFVVSVKCSLENGSARQTMRIDSVSELIRRLDELLVGERKECPRGPAQFSVEKMAGPFHFEVPEGLTVSQSLLSEEIAILELLLQDKYEAKKHADGEEDAEDDSEKWKS